MPRSPRPERPRMRLVQWRAVAGTGTLRGFATVELPNGLTIVDCPVHVGGSAGQAWAALPARPVLDDRGQHVSDPARPGKRQWSAVLRWRDRELGNAWSARVVALVREAYPKGVAP
jgi:hypothetical protein